MLASVDEKAGAVQLGGGVPDGVDVMDHPIECVAP